MGAISSQHAVLMAAVADRGDDLLGGMEPTGSTDSGDVAGVVLLRTGDDESLGCHDRYRERIRGTDE